MDEMFVPTAASTAGYRGSGFLHRTGQPTLEAAADVFDPIAGCSAAGAGSRRQVLSLKCHAPIETQAQRDSNDISAGCAADCERDVPGAVIMTAQSSRSPGPGRTAAKRAGWDWGCVPGCAHASRIG